VKVAEQQAREQAQRDRQTFASSYKPDFWDQLAGLAEGFAAAAEAGNAQVTVSNYYSAGDYLFSKTMTRSRAAGLGPQPSN